MIGEFVVFNTTTINKVFLGTCSLLAKNCKNHIKREQAM